MKKFVSILLIILVSSSFVFADDSTAPEPYTDDEFPQWAKYLRRFEIITLGSLPFTTLTATTCYTIYRYCANDFDPNLMPNPLALTSAAAKLDKEEQKNILITAASVSLVAGTVDLIINIIKTEKAKKQNAQKLAASVTVKEKTSAQSQIQIPEGELPSEENSETIEDDAPFIIQDDE